MTFFSLRPLARPATLALATFLLGACAGIRGRDPSTSPEDGRLITAEMIARTQARTAWEALRHTVRYVDFTENDSGEPARVRSRGSSSVILTEDMRIFVDGVRVPDLRMLDRIPVEEVESIRVLNGIDGTTRYGTNATDGVILIATRTSGG